MPTLFDERREQLPCHSSGERGAAARGAGSQLAEAALGNTLDIDDVIQESYSRIAGLDSIAHIDNLRSYFFRTAHAVATDIMRRAKVENFSRLTEIEWSNVLDESPSPDRVIEGVSDRGDAG